MSGQQHKTKDDIEFEKGIPNYDLPTFDTQSVDWALRYGLAQADWLPGKSTDSNLLTKLTSWVGRVL